MVFASMPGLVAAQTETGETADPAVDEPKASSIVKPASDNAVRRALEGESSQSDEPSDPTDPDAVVPADPVSRPPAENPARRAVEGERAGTTGSDKDADAGTASPAVLGTTATDAETPTQSIVPGGPVDQGAPSAAEPTAPGAAVEPAVLPTSEPQSTTIELDAPLTGESDDAQAEARESALREEQADLTSQRQVLEEIEEDAADDETTSAALPEPCTGPWDWVHLSSGEWLRGEFKRMRKRRFEMRSTRFNLQTTDWKHIVGFCFPGNTRFILEDHTVMTGRGRLENGVLTVVSDNVTQSAPRDDIWVILPGLAVERNRWRATLSVGLDTYTGNTDQQSVTAAASIDREDANSHLSMSYDGSFGRADGDTNVARHSASESMNIYFTRLFYASTPFIDYTSDRFKNLQHRVASGASLGVKLFDLESFEWSVDAGLAYQYSQYVEVLPGQAIRENDWGPRLSSSLEWDIVTDLTLTIDQQTVILTRDFGQTNYHTQVALTYEITDLLYIELGFWHDRVRDPQQATVDFTPDPDDFRYLASVGLNFD